MSFKLLNQAAGSRLVLTTAVCGVALSLLVFFIAQRWESGRMEEDFVRHAENRVAAMKLTMRERVSDVEDLAAALGAVERVGYREFQALGRQLAKGNPAVRSVEWVPVVPGAEREEFEREARKAGAGKADGETYRNFRIFELHGTNQIPAGERGEYLPLLYVTREGEGKRIGLNLGVDGLFRDAASRAAEHGRAAASARFEVEEGLYCFRVVVPVGKLGAGRDEGDEEIGSVAGFVSVVFDIETLVDFCWSHLQPVGLDKLIFDASLPEEDATLYTQWSRLRDAPPEEQISIESWRRGMYYEDSFPVADRRWSVVVKEGPAFVPAHKTHVPMSVLVGGLLLTGALAGYLWVTGRRTAELAALNGRLVEEAEERKRSRDDLSAIFNSVNVAIFIHSPEGRILAVNDKTLELYRIPAEKALSYSLKEDYSDESNPNEELDAIWRRAVEGESCSMEWLAKRPLDGTTFPGELYLRRITWNGSVAVMGVVHDLTEKKELQRQFLRAQRLESIGTLASGIAHDLNNILAPVIMSAQYLQMRDDVRREDYEILETIQTSAQRGADIVRQVLTFARGIEGERVILQVGHLIKEMRRIVRETFPKNIEFHCDVAGDLFAVSADATQLHQVLMNLCVNARDAMPDGGELLLSAENVEVTTERAGLFADGRPGRYVLMKVVDTGHGMPAAMLEKVFDPFFTTKPLGHGTGLGLSTVLGIVRSHQGFVDVQTEPGKGTSFLVYLPAAREPARRLPCRPIAALPRGSGQRILFVDDEPSIRSITECTLTQHGYEVILAANGRDALEALSNCKELPDAVVTDLRMPVMDGITFVEALQKAYPEITVIACTGLAQDGLRTRLKGLGVQWVLQKPYSSEGLLGAVGEAVARSHHLKT